MVSSTPTAHPDQELLRRAKEDPAGIALVYDAYADAVYGFLLKRCAHKETAEDITSKTFLKFLEALPTFEWTGAPLLAWLFRVAQNQLTDHWRLASTKRDLHVEDDETFDPPSDDNPAWSAELSMEGERVREALKELSARDQEVLSLRFFAGLENQEVAKQLGVSDNHAAVLVYRAIGRLRTVFVSRQPTSIT